MEWNSGDFLLYNAVNQSLDLTIEKLGRDNVDKKLQEYKKLLDIGTKWWYQKSGSKGDVEMRWYTDDDLYVEDIYGMKLLLR